MKQYSTEEKASAEKTLGKPTSDFLNSKELGDIYAGIGKKLKLNLRQLAVVCEIANVTLLGLEPESSFETNIHQELHELSNADTRELVADVNDRVFKEARRRLEQNIIVPGKPWDTDALGSREDYEKALVSDSAFDAEVAAEEAQTGKPYVPEIEQLRKHEEEAGEKVQEQFEAAVSGPVPGENYDALENFDIPAEEDVPPPPAAPAPASASGISITRAATALENAAGGVPQKVEAEDGPVSALAKEKLAVPKVSLPKQVSAASPAVSAVQTPPPASPAPASTPQTQPQAPAAPSPTTPPYKGSDPYRESIG